MFQNFLKQKQNFSIVSKNFGTKPKRFDVVQNLLKQFILQGSLTTSTGTFLASFGLCYTLTASIDILRDLFKPLKHLKASIDTLTASTDTLTASKALSRPLQSTCTLLACKRQFTRTFSRLWECCWGLFGLPYKGTLTAFISTLLASTDTFLASTTLKRPTLILMGPCKHSHSSATVSRPPVELSLYKHSHCLYKHSYNLYMHSQGLYKHSVVRSCQLFFKIYIFTAHIVQKNFWKAMRGLLEAMRVLLEAVVVVLEAVRVFAGAFVMSTKSKRKHQTFRYRS